jgi:hypothetical protein
LAPHSIWWVGILAAIFRDSTDLMLVMSLWDSSAPTRNG